MTEPQKRTRKPYKRVEKPQPEDAQSTGVPRRRRRTGPSTPAWRAAGLEPHEPEEEETD